MPSPFPGMDPYLEAPRLWPTVHFWLLASLAESLQSALPPPVIVSVEERVYVVAPDEDPPRAEREIVPDVLIRGEGLPQPGAASALLSRPVEVLAPVPEVVRERYLELRDRGEGEKLLTVIEVLSPSNKRAGPGRTSYFEKRVAILGSETSLVEIDLLRMGQRMPVIDAPGRNDYSVFVSPGNTRPRSNLYPFSVRNPLPVFPVPLRPEVPPVPVDLSAVLSAAYDRSRIAQRLDYTRPSEPPLAPEDAAWAEALLREQGLR